MLKRLSHMERKKSRTSKLTKNLLKKNQKRLKNQKKMSLNLRRQRQRIKRMNLKRSRNQKQMTNLKPSQRKLSKTPIKRMKPQNNKKMNLEILVS